GSAFTVAVVHLSVEEDSSRPVPVFALIGKHPGAGCRPRRICRMAFDQDGPEPSPVGVLRVRSPSRLGRLLCRDTRRIDMPENIPGRCSFESSGRSILGSLRPRQLLVGVEMTWVSVLH